MNQLTELYNRYLNALVERGAAFGVLVGLVPAMLFLYLGYIFLIAPGIAVIEFKGKTVAALETEAARGRAVEAGQEEFKRAFANTVALFYESLPVVPVESEISNVLNGVQSVAARHRVVLTGLNAAKEAQKTANADKLYEREIPASVVGNYDDVMRFFLDLSRQTRILIIRDYTVSAAFGKPKEARPLSVAVDFTLLAYHAPPTAEFPNLPPEINTAAPRGAAPIVSAAPTGAGE